MTQFYLPFWAPVPIAILGASMSAAILRVPTPAVILRGTYPRCHSEGTHPCCHSEALAEESIAQRVPATSIYFTMREKTMLALQNIMELASMKDAKVLFGYTMCQIEVTGITIMEAPDIANWMSEGQILLCSLYSLPKDETSMNTFVEALSRAKIAALFIKSREGAAISPLLISVCMEYRLNLVQIPEDMAYSIIMYEVMGQLFDNQLNRASYFKRYHDIFMRVALEGKGVDAIVQTLAQQVNGNLILYDNEQTVLATGGHAFMETPLIEPDRDYVQLIYGNIACFEKSIMLADKVCKGIAIPIKVFNRIKAYLFVDYHTHGEFPEFEWIAIENAITVLKLEITKEIALNEIEQKFKNDLADDLFSGKPLSEEVIYDRAQVIGWDLKRPYRCLIAQVDLKNMDAEQCSHVMGELASSLRQMICDTWKVPGRSCIIRILNRSLVALLPVGEEDDDSNLQRCQKIAEGFFSKAQEQGAEKQTAAGLGEVAANIHQLCRSYGEAMDSLRFGRKIEAEVPVYSFRNLGVYRLICSFEDKELLKSFIPPYLKKLMEHSTDGDKTLLTTLEAFLDCSCSPQKAAEKLFVHHKTLVYRINKIKSIMGIETFDSEKKLEMQIAFKILQLKDELQ